MADVKKWIDALPRDPEQRNVFPRRFLDRYGRWINVDLTRNPGEVYIITETGESYYFTAELAECVGHSLIQAASILRGERQK